jgi:hypothetical protein
MVFCSSETVQRKKHSLPPSESKPRKRLADTRGMLHASAGFCLAYFDPEDGGDMILRNVSLFLTYTMLQPGRPYA